MAEDDITIDEVAGYIADFTEEDKEYWSSKLQRMEDSVVEDAPEELDDDDVRIVFRAKTYKTAKKAQITAAIEDVADTISVNIFSGP